MIQLKCSATQSRRAAIVIIVKFVNFDTNTKGHHFNKRPTVECTNAPKIEVMDECLHNALHKLEADDWLALTWS